MLSDKIILSDDFPTAISKLKYQELLKVRIILIRNKTQEKKYVTFEFKLGLKLTISFSFGK